MKNTFTTVDEVIAHLTSVKERVDKIVKKNPDLSFSGYSISEIPLDLMYALADHGKESRPKYSNFGDISFSNDRLSIYSWYGLPLSCSFTSVKCRKNDECVIRREFVEVVETVSA